MTTFIDTITINQHRITIKDNKKEYGRKKNITRRKHIEDIIRRQREYEDVYITTYPEDNRVSTLIFDFDCKEDPESARHEAGILERRLAYEGYNCVLVKSGGKGYHLYVQTPIHDFNSMGEENANILFKCYIRLLIPHIDVYYTLDMTHLNAGLYSNIRLLGSKHSKTGETCKIIKGEFKETPLANFDNDDSTLQQAKIEAETEISKVKEKREQSRKLQLTTNNDLKEATDLREVFKQLADNCREYGEYMMCNCIFHNEKHPSLRVTHDYYYCASCNAKGNIYTLIKEGIVSPYNDLDEKELNKLIEGIT